MEFECEYYNKNLSSGMKYCCRVIKVTIIQPGARDATFKGTHEAGKTNINVKSLWITGKQVEYFPRGLSSIYPTLTNVQVSNCGLKNISRKDFEGLSNLKSLNLRNNELRSLPNDLFVETPNLCRICLQGNKIKRLRSKILDPLDKTNLKEFCLKGNLSIDVVFMQGGKTTLEAFIKEINVKCLPPIEESLVKPRQPPIKPENRFKKFEGYFVTGKFCDPIIKFRGKEYKVHKNILSAQSSVIESIIQQRTIKKIKTMSDDAFEDFLRYFYFGSIRSENNAMELFRTCS